MKKLALVIALTAAVALVCGVFATPSDAFFGLFGGKSGCSTGSYGGYYGGYGCAPACCAPAYCMPYCGPYYGGYAPCGPKMKMKKKMK
jgi:hypothetical protein